jgi:hypothetical protein
MSGVRWAIMAHLLTYRSAQEATMKTSDPITGATAAILLCAALAAMAGNTNAANAPVNRCVDVEGRVTITDEACPRNSRAVNDDVSDSGGAGLVLTTGAAIATDAITEPGTGNGLEPVITPLPRSRWADLPRPLVRKAVGTDAQTLQTARTTLLMRDELRRQTRTVATR